MIETSNKHFRSVDEWKSALMTLPENKFFELFRSVLGNIKTPFSKQKLLTDLFNLLSRNEIQKIIAAYLDEQDHKVIAAIALLNDPVMEEMDSFFAGEFTHAELYALLINLEERLILYRIRDKETLRLTLNPVLEKVLAPLIADTRPLFPSIPLESGVSKDHVQAEMSLLCSRPETSILDGRILAAFFSFVIGQEEMFPIDVGTEPEETSSAENSFKEISFPRIRKKVLDEGKKIFPALDLRLTIRTLLILELFNTEGRSLVPCRERIADFSSLSSMERLVYWAAGVFLCLDGTDGNAHNGGYFRNRPRRTAFFIQRFLYLIEGGKLYPEIILRRLGELLEREDGGAGNVLGLPVFGGQAGSRWGDSSQVQFPFESLMAVMEKTGLLEREGSYWKAGPVFVASTRKDSVKQETPETKPVIVMDAAFSFILYPEISFFDALALGEFCSVKENAGGSVRFEITRQSVVRGFDQGIGSAAMIELLSRLSGNRLDENLGWTLKEWESRYAGVSLNHGVVLTLAEDLRYLAETKPVSSLIQRTLAPGVYLLLSRERSDAAVVLRKAGVDIIAQPPLQAAGKSPGIIFGIETGGGFLRHSFARLGSVESGFLSALSVLKSKGGTAACPSTEADSIRENFRSILDKMKFSKAEKEELAARIERRLVLTKAQLEGASLRYEKLEARGLDYPGKSVIAKQAIEAGSLLDVSWPGPGGAVSRVIGKPQALEKREGDSILVLKNSDAAGAGETAFQDTVRIPLGKISLMRRIKQSIFEG